MVKFYWLLFRVDLAHCSNPKKEKIINLFSNTLSHKFNDNKIMSKTFSVYILANKKGALYTGVTNDLLQRVSDHKKGQGSHHTRKYKINHLVYHEETSDAFTAIEREKEIKRWNRNKKLELIRTVNPQFKDLSDGWYEKEQK